MQIAIFHLELSSEWERTQFNQILQSHESIPLTQRTNPLLVSKKYYGTIGEAISSTDRCTATMIPEPWEGSTLHMSIL
jgi:hypothetical protein